jgi:hypothetical protein
MNKLRSLLLSLGLGAGLMYFYDPDQGRRRRAQMRDQIDSVKNRSDEAIDKTVRDFQNRSRGWVAEASSIFNRKEASDWVVRERIRSRLGFLSSHPGSIDVEVMEGIAHLSGPILAEDVDGVIAGISTVPGVRNVENRLEVHESPEGDSRFTG